MRNLITYSLLFFTTTLFAQDWKTDMKKVNDWFMQKELHVNVVVEQTSQEGKTKPIGKASLDKYGETYHTRFNNNEMITDGEYTVIIDHEMKKIRITGVNPSTKNTLPTAQDFEKMAQNAKGIQHVNDKKGVRTYHMSIREESIQDCWISFNLKTGALITYSYTFLDNSTSSGESVEKITSTYQVKKEALPSPTIKQIVTITEKDIVGLGKYSTYKCSRI